MADDIGVRKGAVDVIGALERHVQKSNPEGINQYTKGGGHVGDIPGGGHVGEVDDPEEVKPARPGAVAAENADDKYSHKAAVDYHKAQAEEHEKGMHATVNSMAGKTWTPADTDKLNHHIYSKNAHEAAAAAHQTAHNKPVKNQDGPASKAAREASKTAHKVEESGGKIKHF